jgi:hypothetical protein
MGGSLSFYHPSISGAVEGEDRMSKLQFDDDRTRMHVDSTKGIDRAYCQLVLVVAAIVVLLAGTLHAQGAVPDSLLFPHPFPAEGSTKSPDDISHFSYAISGLFTVKSEGMRNGFGIGFSGFFDRFRPFFLSAGLDIVISTLHKDGLPHADFVILSPALDLTLRRSTGRLRPYAGIGINAHFSHLILDEPADANRSWYDSTTQARQIDLGWGIAPHVRAGFIIPIGGRHQILLESRFMSASHAADVSYRDRRTGNEWKGTVDYRIPSVWISLGIIRTPEPGKKHAI